MVDAKSKKLHVGRIQKEAEIGNKVNGRNPAANGKPEWSIEIVAPHFSAHSSPPIPQPAGRRSGGWRRPGVIGPGANGEWVNASRRIISADFSFSK
ncbi:MAG: hypothetical protein Q7S85_09945 [Rugosibacter sp.]|nr:hypothetical protein [Rugosibacter sp.]